MSRRTRKAVRFSLPSTHTDQPPSILRRQTRGNLDLDYQPALARRASLPSSSMSPASRMRGIEALHGLRDYIKDACNFHGEQYRRALCAPSVNALCELTAFVANLRGDSRSVTTPDERLLHRVLDCAKPHPHEQLAHPPEHASRHARNAVRAHRKRARREADFHLLQFVARQLRLPARALRELSSRHRHIREVEAFKERILKFYGPDHGGTTSAPQSPAGRPLTAPRSPATDPMRWEHTHGALSGTPHDLFPEQMAQLTLTAPVAHDPRLYPHPARPHVPPTPPQRQQTSPYVPVQTPPQHFPPSPYHSPYVYSAGPTGGYQRTPPQPPVSMPYGAAYQQQYVSTAQTFAPPPVNLPQSVGTPQQNVAQAPAVPGVAIPPSVPGRTSAPHTPLQTALPTPHTPQQQQFAVPQHTPQQPLQHPTPGSTNATTPQQSLPPTPMSHVVPGSQQHVPVQPSQVRPMQQIPVQTVPGSGSFVLPVPTAVPTVLPTVQYLPQQYAAQQPQQPVQPHNYPAGYQQQHQQYAQQYQQGYQNRGGKQQKG